MECRLKCLKLSQSESSYSSQSSKRLSSLESVESLDFTEFVSSSQHSNLLCSNQLSTFCREKMILSSIFQKQDGKLTIDAFKSKNNFKTISRLVPNYLNWLCILLIQSNCKKTPFACLNEFLSSHRLKKGNDQRQESCKTVKHQAFL